MHAQSGTYVSGPACGSYNASSPSGKNTSAGFPCPWSGFDRWAIIPAAVHVHASRGVRFSNCSFRRLGATAVAFDKGSQNCSVASSLVEDVSGNGVQIGTIDSYNETVSSPTQLKGALFHHAARHRGWQDSAKQDAGNVVVDSVVRNVGREWLGTCGIIAFYSRGSRVLHNEVRDPC